MVAHASRLAMELSLEAPRSLRGTSSQSAPDDATTMKQDDVPGTGSLVLGQEDAPPRATDAAVDRRNWTFRWPAETMARPQLATAAGFAGWLHEQSETNLTRRALTSLYAEYVEANELRPLRWHEFDRSLRAAGILRYRSSLRGRPWLYRIEPPQTARVYSLNQRAR